MLWLTAYRDTACLWAASGMSQVQFSDNQAVGYLFHSNHESYYSRRLYSATIRCEQFCKRQCNSQKLKAVFTLRHEDPAPRGSTHTILLQPLVQPRRNDRMLGLRCRNLTTTFGST